MKIGSEKSEIWVGGRTVTTASPRYLKRSDPLHKNSARIKPIEEYEDCVIHGDADGFAVKDLNGNEELVSVTMLAEWLSDDEKTQGKNIRLISCSTGKKHGV